MHKKCERYYYLDCSSSAALRASTLTLQADASSVSSCSFNRVRVGDCCAGEGEEDGGDDAIESFIRLLEPRLEYAERKVLHSFIVETGKEDLVCRFLNGLYGFDSVEILAFAPIFSRQRPLIHFLGDKFATCLHTFLLRGQIDISKVREVSLCDTQIPSTKFIEICQSLDTFSEQGVHLLTFATLNQDESFVNHRDLANSIPTSTRELTLNGIRFETVQALQEFLTICLHRNLCQLRSITIHNARCGRARVSNDVCDTEAIRNLRLESLKLEGETGLCDEDEFDQFVNFCSRIESLMHLNIAGDDVLPSANSKVKILGLMKIGLLQQVTYRKTRSVFHMASLVRNLHSSRSTSLTLQPGGDDLDEYDLEKYRVEQLLKSAWYRRVMFLLGARACGKSRALQSLPSDLMRKVVLQLDLSRQCW